MDKTSRIHQNSCYVPIVLQQTARNMASSEQWRTFLHQCLIKRVDVTEFRSLTKLLYLRCSIAEVPLMDLLLESQAATGIKWDPLLPLYIDCLCKMGRVKASTVLGSLLKHSSICEKLQSEHKEKKQKRYTLMTDIKVIQDLILPVSTGNIPRTLAEATNLFSAVVDWIQAVLAWNNKTMDDGQQQDGLMGSPDLVSLFESLGILLAVLSATGKGLEVLSSDSHEGIFWLAVYFGYALMSSRSEDQVGTGPVGLYSIMRSSIDAHSQ